MRNALLAGMLGLVSVPLAWQALAHRMERPDGFGQGAVDPARFSCRAACLASAPTPYCLGVPRDPKLASAFATVRQRFMDPGADRLSSAELMRSFEVTSDPCERGDTIRVGDSWENRGGACRATANLDMFLDGTTIPVTVELPDRVIFRVTRTQNELSLVPRESATLVSIGDANLHHDWGGVIREIISTPQATMFQLSRGCVMIPT